MVARTQLLCKEPLAGMKSEDVIRIRTRLRSKPGVPANVQMCANVCKCVHVCMKMGNKSFLGVDWSLEKHSTKENGNVDQNAQKMSHQ